MSFRQSRSAAALSSELGLQAPAMAHRPPITNPAKTIATRQPPRTCSGLLGGCGLALSLLRRRASRTAISRRISSFFSALCNLWDLCGFRFRVSLGNPSTTLNRTASLLWKGGLTGYHVQSVCRPTDVERVVDGLVVVQDKTLPTVAYADYVRPW